MCLPPPVRGMQVDPTNGKPEKKKAVILIFSYENIIIISSSGFPGKPEDFLYFVSCRGRLYKYTTTFMFFEVNTVNIIQQSNSLLNLFLMGPFILKNSRKSSHFLVGQNFLV